MLSVFCYRDETVPSYMITSEASASSEAKVPKKTRRQKSVLRNNMFFVQMIWPNGIIFHQPRFPWNFRGFPLLNHHLGKIGRVRSLYNLTRDDVIPDMSPFTGKHVVVQSDDMIYGDNVRKKMFQGVGNLKTQKKKHHAFFCMHNWLTMWVFRKSYCELQIRNGSKHGSE